MSEREEAGFEWKHGREAPKLYLGSLMDQADQTTDPALADDLRFGAQIATDLANQGAQALVVGGYVRDLVLSKLTERVQEPTKDIDIEVYGIELDALHGVLDGYGPLNSVGASFSTIKLTNPTTGSRIDFSTPRRDLSSGLGHTDFDVVPDPAMTVAEAAQRRDLTINAMALNPLTGELIDEFGGVADLNVGVLRAVDLEQFGTDPLRVLRVVQFAGRFGFTVDLATAELCKTIDLTQISGERIGDEWIKLLTKSEKPSIGLEVARQIGVLDQLHPQFAVLETIAQDPEWHPEGNVWVHTKLTVDAAAQVIREEGVTGDDALVVLFGALCHDLGKATTTELRDVRGVQRITAHGHAPAGVEPASQFLKQLKLKGDIVRQILPIVREHLYCFDNPEPTDKQLRKFTIKLGPATTRLWDLVCRSDVNGRGLEYEPQTQSYNFYDRSLGLSAAPIIRGQDLIDQLGLEPGAHFGVILKCLYAAQLEEEFGTLEEGIVFYQAQAENIQILVDEYHARMKERHHDR